MYKYTTIHTVFQLEKRELPFIVHIIIGITIIAVFLILRPVFTGYQVAEDNSSSVDAINDTTEQEPVVQDLIDNTSAEPPLEPVAPEPDNSTIPDDNMSIQEEVINTSEEVINEPPAVDITISNITQNMEVVNTTQADIPMLDISSGPFNTLAYISNIILNILHSIRQHSEHNQLVQERHFDNDAEHAFRG
jgi:hypothetical protein